jgi:hypothetical protein
VITALVVLSSQETVANVTVLDSDVKRKKNVIKMGEETNSPPLLLAWREI